MCLDCGCGKPNDDHGDPRHITLDRIEQAAAASEIPVHEAVHNIQQGFRMARSQEHNAVNWNDAETQSAG